MTPEVRQLLDEIKSKAALIERHSTPGDDYDLAKAETIAAETNELERRYNLAVSAERLKSQGLDALQEDETRRRDELRRRAQAAAAAGGEPRGTDINTGGTEGEGESRTSGGEGDITTEHLADYQKFTREFGGLLQEMRERRSPQQEKRRLAFRKALVGGPKRLTKEERQLIQVQRAGSAAIEEQRAMGLGDAASLGLLVPPETMEEIKLATLAFGGFREPALNVTWVRTNTGRTIPMPTVDDTSNEGSFRGEHASHGDATDPVVEPHELGAYYLSSGVMKISVELAQDESFGLETFLTRLGTIRNERRFQRSLTTGRTTGQVQNQCKGIMVGITSGKTAANTAEFVPQDFWDLFGSVDSSYHPGMSVMMSNDALTNLKIMAGGIGQGLWQPGLAAGQPSSIDGKPYAINYHMDTVDTGNKPVVAGDLSWMVAREVVPPYFLRLTERYADNGQIGFILATRVDGRLVDPGVTPVKCLTMA